MDGQLTPLCRYTMPVAIFPEWLINITLPGWQQPSTSMHQDQQPKINEGQQEQLTLFSTPESHFVFKGPPTLQIKSTVKGQKNYCTIDQDSWSWRYAGNPTTIQWIELSLNRKLVEILKAFIFHRLQKLSPNTVSSNDLRWLMFLGTNTDWQLGFPWDSEVTILRLLSLVKKDSNIFYGFKAFYKFGFSRGLSGFTKELNDIIEETRAIQRGQYQKILLQQFNKLSPADESILLDYIYTPPGIEDYTEYRDNIILHLAFELGSPAHSVAFYIRRRP